MVTSLSVEWPHTVSLLGFPKIRNQILNLICNRFCGSELLIREATDVGMFLFWIACFFGMRIPCVKLLGLHSNRMWLLGSPFLGQVSLLICGGSFPLVKGPALVPHHVSLGCAFCWDFSISCV